MLPNMRLGLILFLFHFYFLSFSQEYFTTTRKISMEEGLSHYKALSFYLEEDGMWIGTADGLNFFDGYKWKYWTKDDGHLTSNAVNFIHKDQEDYLWLLNTKKVDERKYVRSIDILNAKRDSAISFEEKFNYQPPFEISAIQNFFEDQQKRLYFFANNQLWRYTSDSQFEVVTLPQGFAPYAILSDGYYVGRLQGKLVLVSSTGDLLYTSDYLLNDEHFTIIGDHQKFWVWQHLSPAQTFKKSTNGDYQVSLFPIQQEKEEYFGFITYDKDLEQLCVKKDIYTYIYDKEEDLIYKHKITPRVACYDHNGNLWLGKLNVTVLRLEKKRFKSYLKKDKGKFEFRDLYHCRGILEKDGKLYINTYQGIKIIDLNKNEILPYLQNLKVNFGIIKDRNDQIWTGHEKLIHLDKSDVHVKSTFGGEKERYRIWSLFEDRENRFWVGGIGLSYLEEGKIKPFEKYNDFQELAEGLILFFYKDKNGVIWVGSDRGLYQLDLQKGIISRYGKSSQSAFRLPSNKFQHMYQDAQGIFWLVTEDAGLIRWNKATGDIQQFNKTHGMPTNNIYSIYEDDFGFLWLSSFNGLIRFQKDSKNITTYHEEDGICENEFNRISHYQADNGQLFFGSQNGVTAFHPKDFFKEKSSQREFELQIKHTSIFGINIFKDVLKDGSKIDLTNLRPGARVIDFEIVSSDLFWTDKIDLHYTLETVNKNQKKLPAFKEKISSDNHVELFGMLPGSYILQVKAIQKNGKQLGETITIPLKINKPIYHTNTFWAFVLFLTGIGIWGFIKYRTARLRKNQAELKRMVEERTNQISKDQQIILSQAEQIVEMKNQLERKDEIWLQQFQAIINKRLNDANLGLPDIINNMDISRSAFYEKVKTLTNMTPNQYIQELRLTKAKVILEEGDVRTVKEVAYAVGINRPSYFSKLFKERFGYLPSDYFRNSKN